MNHYPIVNYELSIINYKQLMLYLVGICFLFIGALLPLSAQAGALDSPAATTAAGSAMFTITDIYNRLNTGAVATKRAGGFTEPAAGPTAGTGKTLDDVMTLVNSRAPVEKTGAKAIGGYAANANEDISLQKGVTWPVPRFTDNGNGTVTDNLTGLIWLKSANCAGVARNWATALTDVANLNSAGTMNTVNCADTSNAGSNQTDWRLPNIKELFSLTDLGNGTPALPTGHPFTGVQSDYWSSTTFSANTTTAFGANLVTGEAVVSGKSGLIFVWPVRGGQ